MITELTMRERERESHRETHTERQKEGEKEKSTDCQLITVAGIDRTLKISPFCSSQY